MVIYGTLISSKEPLFIVNGDHHRNPQLDTIQSLEECGGPNGYICVTALAPTTQGITWKREQKNCRSQKIRKSTVNRSLLESVA